MTSLPFALPASRLRGFSLVEVALAIGILAFGLVSIFGLLPIGLSTLRDGGMEEAGTDLLAMAAADLRATPPLADAASPIFQVKPYPDEPEETALLLTSTGAVAPSDQEAAFRLIAAPLPSADPTLAVWRLRVEWPPQAPTPAGQVETLLFLQR